MEPAGNRIREERLQEEAEEEGRETRKLWSALPFSRSKTGVSLSLSLSKSHPTCNPERRCRPPHLSDQEDRQAAWRDKDLREYGRSRPRQIRQIEMRRNRRSGEPRTEIQNPARRGWKLRDSGNSLPGCDKEEGASQSEHGDEHGRKEHPPLPFEVLQGGGGGGGFGRRRRRRPRTQMSARRSKGSAGGSPHNAGIKSLPALPGAPCRRDRPRLLRLALLPSLRWRRLPPGGWLLVVKAKFLPRLTGI